MINGIIFSLIGTGFTFLMTVLGSAAVFLFSSKISYRIQKIFLGFASGVMISASVWSLLLPSIQIAEEQGKVKWLPAACGFVFGWLFILIIDYLFSHLNSINKSRKNADSSLSSTTMMVLAVTLHNIPEGLAVGLSCGMAMNENSLTGVSSAIVLSIGMGLQNFPEGAAVSLPLSREGVSKKKAFLIGSLSGIVEPIAGVVGVILLNFISSIMPFMLAFAAGAMIYVVIEELIPELSLGEQSNSGTTGVMIGFLIMMVLDTLLS